MNTVTSRPNLIAPNPEGVPEKMRLVKRWAPWRAVWNPNANKGKGKYEKIPHRAARPEYGLSNKNAAGWVSFDEAMSVYLAHPDKFSGVGYLMTGPHGVTGVDLDHCVDPVSGEIAEWAREVIAKLDTYTEISPSGTGLHAMVAGDLPEDWMNHDQGIEVYGGNKARFLCITGVRVPGTRAALVSAAADTLQLIEAKYRTSRSKADVEDLHLPPLLPVELLPTLAELDLPAHARNFLTDGPVSSDRSKELINAATALAQAGLEPDEVLSILEDNEHAIGVALDHRRQDYDKALRFLWKHSALQGEARASNFQQLRLDDFDDLKPPAQSNDDQISAAPTGTVMDDFDALPDEGKSNNGQEADTRHADLAPVKTARFAPESATQFLKHSAPNWIIKGVLPRAGLGVIYGASSSGKTFFTLDLVGAVARGVEWRGVQAKKGRVLYVVAEGAGGFRNRLQAYCEAHEVDPGQFDIGFLRQAPNLLTKDDIREFLKEVIAYGKVDLIVIDTYARAMAGGNENDAKDVGQAVAHCDIIHRKTGAMVLLVHHSGKDATKGARGSGALRAAADLEIEVVQTREYRAATVTKQKDGADSAEYQFKLAEIAIGMDEDDELITSCTVEHCATSVHPGERKTNPEGANEKLIYKYMEGILGGSIKRDELIENTFEMLDHDAAPGQKDRRKERVSRAIKSLARKNLLEDEGVMVVLK